MDSMSLTDMLVLVLVVAGVAAEVLERAARRRAGQPAAHDRGGDRAPAGMDHALPR